MNRDACGTRSTPRLLMLVQLLLWLVWYVALSR